MKFPTSNKKHSNFKSKPNSFRNAEHSNSKSGHDNKSKNNRIIAQKQSAGKQFSKIKKSNTTSFNSNAPHKVEQYDEQNTYNENYDHDDENEAFDAHQHIKASKSNGLKGKYNQNQQYEQLMQQSGKGFKRQKNMYFLQNQKYKGRQKKHQQKDYEQQENEDEQGNQQMQNQAQENSQQDYNSQQGQNFDEQQAESQQQAQQQQKNNEIHQALSLLKQKRKSTSRLLNQQLISINQEDKIHLNQIKKLKSKSTQEQINQSIQLKKLLEIYDQLVELRYGQQNQLQEIKQYPKCYEELDQPKYPPLSHQLFTISRQLENQMITNLSQYLKVYQQLAKKCNLTGSKTSVGKKANTDNQDSEENHNENENQDVKNKNNEDLQTKSIDLEQLIQAENQDNLQQAGPRRLNVDKIYQFAKEQMSPSIGQVQKMLIKWSQKTSFLTSNASSHQLNSLLMQTPIGQAKKVLSNWERMAHKCQQKRGQQPFKILFQQDQNIHELSDPQIYDDYDLFIQLEKYYLEKLDKGDDDNQFLQSATMKYLKNRQANQLQHEKKQKDVDRKASKNRKIRYNVHAKLLNFMPACEQHVIETRDQIVRNIFNCNSALNEESMEGNVSKYRSAQPHGHDEEVEFIEVE